MPPAANDNQGLKIATALLAALVVVLGVSTYFGFSQSAYYQEKLGEAQTEASNKSKAANDLQNSLNELKQLAGYESAKDGTLKDTIKADQDKMRAAVTAVRDQVKAVYEQYKTAAGEALPQTIDEFANVAQTAAESISNDPGGSLQSSLGRMSKLLGDHEQLLAAIAADSQAVRKELEGLNQVAQQKINVEVEARKKVEARRPAELAKHNEDRQSLISQLDSERQKNQDLQIQVADKTNDLAASEAKAKQEYADLDKQFRREREKAGRLATRLETPSGSITFIDYNAETVRTSLNSRMGATEQMVFTVFDREGGIPNDKVKGTIELISVDERGSLGRILSMEDPVNPIRQGDYIFSPAFGARPRQYAIIGPIEINGLEGDDRAQLTQMIRSRGGEVVFDLPPPSIGSQRGKISPSIDYYVTDEAPEQVTGDATEYLKQLTATLNEVRAAGVQAISLERLVSQLGYKFRVPYQAPTPGQVERIDPRARDLLRQPAGSGTTPPPPDDAATPPADGER